MNEGTTSAPIVAAGPARLAGPGDRARAGAVALPGALVLVALAAALRDTGGGATWLALCALALLGALTATLAGAARSAAPRATGARLALGALTGAWLWSGASVAWSPAPHASALAFWSLGAAPLAAWLVVLDPRLRRAPLPGPWLLAIALGLALFGLAEQTLLERAPRSLFLHRHGHAAFLALVALPVAGTFLARRAAGSAARRGARGVAAAAFLVLVLAIAGTGGRASTLALWLGLAALVAAARPLAGTRSVVLVLALAAAGYGVAEVGLGRPVTAAAERLAAEGTSVLERGDGSERLRLWRGSLALLADTPWTGIGAGTFWLAYPRYREPAEASAGQHAHNDYLEAAVELGPVGLALVLLAGAGAMLAARRALAGGGLGAGQRIEAAALAAALVGLGVHAAFSFVLHLTPLALVAGLWVGRLAVLAEAAAAEPAPGAARPPGRWLAAALIAVGAANLGGALAGEALERQAVTRLARGDLSGAEASLLRAQRLSASERPLVSLAAVYATGLERARGGDGAGRDALLARAEAVLDEAERRNRLSPMPAMLRGRVLRAGRDRAGPAWRARAEAAYRRALALDPRNLGARRALAQSLLAAGARAAAVRLVEEGAALPWRASPLALPFYALAVRLRHEDGRLEEARALLARVRALAERYRMAPGTLRALGLGPALDALRG